jgi:hypothetical protein
VTHFGIFPGAYRKLPDLEFYPCHLLPLCGKADLDSVAFRVGYFFHLITGNLWNARIGEPSAECFSNEFEANKDFIWEVKKDWYGLDCIFVRDHQNACSGNPFLGPGPQPENWNSFHSRRSASAKSLSRRTIGALTSMVKKRIIEHISTFPMMKWTISLMNPAGNLPEYTNNYGLMVRPRGIPFPH